MHCCSKLLEKPSLLSEKITFKRLINISFFKAKFVGSSLTFIKSQKDCISYWLIFAFKDEHFLLTELIKS